MKIVKNQVNEVGKGLNSPDNNVNINAYYDSSNTTITLHVKTSANTIKINEFDVVSNTVVERFVPQIYQNFTESMNVSSLSLYDHAAFAFWTDSNYEPFEDANTTTNTIVVDTFRASYPTKLRRDEIAALHNKSQYAFLLVPFADCTPDEMLFVLNVDKSANATITYQGFSEELPEIIEQNKRLDFLPKLNAPATLNVSTGSTTSFDVQLIDSNNNTINRPNVIIYMENTGGVLGSNRIVTNANGVATGTITVGTQPTSFKIKTGFKYFSGKKDIIVNVS
jgi:hypothetical protein